MAEIRFTTTADLKGIHDLQAALDRLHDSAKSIAATMKQFGSVQFQGIENAVGGSAASAGSPSKPGARPPHPFNPAPQGAPSFPKPFNPAPQSSASPPQGGKAASGHKAQYDLSTPGGVIEYDENVLAQALPMLNAMRPASIGVSGPSGVTARPRSILQNVPGMTPILGPYFKSKHLPGSTPYYEDWFNRIGQEDVQSVMGEQFRRDYAEARDLWIGGRSITPAEFYQAYSSEANQPTPTPAKPPSFLQRFRQHARGNSIGAILSSGLRGAMIGGAAAGIMGGGGEAGGSALLGGAIGGGAAELLGGGGLASLFNPELLPLLAIPMIASVFKSGYNNWQQTAPTSSQIAHSLGTVGQGANVLNLSIQKAAAAFGVMGSTALQSAQTLVQAFGGNDAATVSLTAQAAKFAMVNGLSDQTQTQLMATLGTLGVTSGVGATLTPYGGNRMLTQLAQTARMQGRQGPLFTGLASIYGTLASINPIISNPLGVAGQYAAMNASGIQGLQGMRGAQLVSRMDQGFANAKGIEQLLGFSAIMRASGGKITDPFQMMSIMEQGSAAKVGNTTLGSAYMGILSRITSDPYLRAAMVPGADINQALALMKSGMFTAGPLRVPTGNLPLQFTQADKNAIAKAFRQYETAKSGQTTALVTTFGNQLYGNIVKSFTTGPAPLSSTAFGRGHLGIAPNTISTPAISTPGIEKMLTAILPSVMIQESGGNPYGTPYTINDNSTGKPGVGTSYYFKTRAAYLAKAKQLLAAGHQLAMGPFQIESFHKGITPENAANVPFATQYAASLLLHDYNASGSWATALRDYSGGSASYAQEVLSRAQDYLAKDAVSSSPAVSSVTNIGLSASTISAIGQAVGREVARAIAQSLHSQAMGRGPTR